MMTRPTMRTICHKTSRPRRLGWLIAALLLPCCQRMEVPVPNTIYDAKHLAYTRIGEVKDERDREALKAATLRLEKDIVEFHEFVRRVRIGEIPVEKNPKGLFWQSVLNDVNQNIYVVYHDWNRPVESFKKWGKQGTDSFFELMFGIDGRLTDVNELNWGMKFDKVGRLTGFYYKMPDGKNKSVKLPSLAPAPR